MYDGNGHKKGDVVALIELGAVEVRAWSPLDRRFDEQDSKLQRLDDCLRHESMLVQEQSTATHSALLSNLLSTLERRYTPTPTLVSRLIACEGKVLARLFIPALKSLDEATFFDALERIEGQLGG